MDRQPDRHRYRDLRMGLGVLGVAGVALFWAPVTGRAQLTDPVVFVSRQIPPDGSDFLTQIDDDRAMPGVGPRERFRVAAPGRLLVREADGRIRALVEGSAPTAASAFLIDVSAPAVSYDGTTIAFAGLPAPAPGQTYDPGSHAEPGRWRVFTIRADGSQLRQITFNDPILDAIDMAAYGRAGEPYHYDDTDPAWLPDGRIVFSSTRWMSHGEYGRSRGTNLHVVNADGTGEHRITSERNGADRPVVDPVTGRVVFARWWLNGRFPTDRTDTIRLPDRGGRPAYNMLNGLLAPEIAPLASGGPGTIAANEWIAASVNPDGTEMRLWTGSVRVPDFVNNYYGGAFTDAGVLYGNFFPDFPLTESGGFGGIRRYYRGARPSDEIWGLTTKTDDFVWVGPPPSLTILRSARGYAADPVPLPDGRLLFSWARNPLTGAEDIGQDYGLFVLDPLNPNQPTPLFDARGTTELRAQLLRPRPVPPIIPDQVPQRPTATPIRSDAEIGRDGTFVFDALNVYFNGPVDMKIVNAPPVGSAATMRFFANYQRAPLNSDMTLNYPVQLDEVAVPPGGAVRHVAPANVALFEDMRRADRSVPLTTLGDDTVGGAFVAGMNYGRPGTVVRCVGCHIGHSQIPVPPSAEAARWSNLAPGARVTVSSTAGTSGTRLVNREARIEPSFNHWRSAPGQTTRQWADLEFPVPVVVRTVRLYAPHDGVSIDQTTVRLFPDLTRAAASAAAVSGPVADGGTDVAFGDVAARVVRVEFTSVRGPHTSLAEIEVIAAAAPGGAPPGNLQVDAMIGNTIRFRWTPPAGPSPDGYVLEGGLAPGQTVATVPTGTVPFFEITPPSGRYYVRVRAVTGGVSSAPSNEVRVSPGLPDPPSPPANLLGLADGNTVHLSWRNTFEGGPSSAIGLYANGTLAATLPASAERFTYRGVPPGSYTIALSAVGLAGAPGPSSNAIALTFPGACTAPPQPPTGMLAYRVGTGVFAIWNPPAAGPAHTGYVVDVSGTYTASIPLTERAIGGTVGPGAYTLQVRAVNPCGSSPSTPGQTVALP